MNSRTAAVEDALTMEHKHFLEGRLSLLILVFCGTVHPNSDLLNLYTASQKTKLMKVSN